jgi:FixJ family two-component response regulator
MHLSETVFIVDDDPAVRDSLQYVIESAGHGVEAFADARQMLERCERPVLGCLVADLRLPGMSGLDMVDRLRERGVDLPVIIITGHGDVTAAVRALKNGALDFIEKPFANQALLSRIHEALKVSQDQQAAARDIAEVRSAYDSLTHRETQVMASVVEGKLNKQIANDLGLSHKTIEVHRAHVMEKMGAKSLAQLVRMAVQLEQQVAG